MKASIRDVLPLLMVFCGLILAFLYFSLGWGTNRLRDHEARRDKNEEKGDPILICWTSAVGSLTFTLVGLHFFGALFFGTQPRFAAPQLIAGLLILVPVCYFWRCLMSLFRFHGIGDLKSPKYKDVKVIVTYTDYLRATVFSLFLLAWYAFFECLFGEFVSGVLLVCFLACGVAGLGSYISVRGDLIERAKAPDQPAGATNAPAAAETQGVGSQPSR